MSKKKKRTSNTSCRTASKVIALLIAIPLICIICLSTSVFRIPEMLSAHAYLQQMKQWEIPPESDYIDFTTYNSGGGNTCWIVGRVTIESQLSADELQGFYNSHYPDFYGYMIAGGLKIEPIENISDQRSSYAIEAIRPFDC